MRCACSPCHCCEAAACKVLILIAVTAHTKRRPHSSRSGALPPSDAWFGFGFGFGLGFGFGFGFGLANPNPNRNPNSNPNQDAWSWRLSLATSSALV